MRSHPSLRKILVMSILPLGLLTACTPSAPPEPATSPEESMNQVAEAYVRLVLALGQHDADYVDAFYGPAEWRQEAEANQLAVADIQSQADAQIAALQALDRPDDEMLQLRLFYLTRQLQALASRARLLGGASMSFDAESQALYDAVAPSHGADHFQAVLDQLETLLAAEGLTQGSVIERLDAFKADFIIPTDKVDTVFREAIDACRQRTLEHLELPADENFEVEYVTGKTWSAYNWYQGNFKSLIQVNLDLPIYIDRAIDLACHEGYPGHHVYNALLEKNLVRDRGWVELSVYPLFSPQSLIAEGSANYGIEMAFPGDQRLQYEKDNLFALAGLDPARAEVYHQVMDLTQQLGFAGNEAARGYRDGELDAEQAVDWLITYAAMSPKRAEQRLRFIEQYRSYVINYNLGLELVRDHIGVVAGDDQALRWQEFGKLLSSPRLPSNLARPAASSDPV